MEEDKKKAEMKQQIQMYLAKKDYYEILGITRQAQDVQIKKSYKKLALRFHPDKNNCEGAKDVFKKVSNAYANLIDPEKRASYDRYGPEEDRAPQFRQTRYQRYPNQEDEFDQIFKAFFGPNFRFQNNQHQHFTFNMGGRNRQQQAHANRQGNFPFFYFLIFIIVLYVVPAFFGNDKPYHSFQASSIYRFKLKTPILQTPFYVREQFFKEAVDVQFKKKTEETVDSQFLIKIKKQCDQATYLKNKYLYQARQYSAGAYRAQLQAKANAVDMSFCQHQKKLHEEYSDYIRNLFYYY